MQQLEHPELKVPPFTFTIILVLVMGNRKTRLDAVLPVDVSPPGACQGLGIVGDGFLGGANKPNHILICLRGLALPPHEVYLYQLRPFESEELKAFVPSDGAERGKESV